MDDLIPLDRAGRIVAPFSQHIERRYFDGGAVRVLRMLGESNISIRALAEPPFLGAMQSSPLTRDWFAELGNGHRPDDCRGWANRFMDWARESMLVSRSSIIAHMRHPAGRYHQPIEHAEATGTSWSFLQALAWIARRSPQI